MKKFFGLLAFLIFCTSASAQNSTWKTFVSKEGRFSVKLPSRPVSSTENPSPNNVSHGFTVSDKNAEFYVSYSDFKPEQIKSIDSEKLLDRARDGGVANVKGKLLAETKISIDGSPGRDITIELPGGDDLKARARFYFVNNRLYTMVLAGPKAISDGADTDTFLGSLKLINPKPLPETWTPLSSTEGRFIIKMPGKPTASNLAEKVKKNSVHLWQLSLEKNEINYFVAYNDLGAVPEKADEIEAALDSGRDALAKSLSATVDEDRLLSVDGNPGREVTMHIGEKDSANSALVLFRGFIVKGRYYQVMALGSKAGMEKGRIEDFMDSFQLTKAPDAKK